MWRLALLISVGLHVLLFLLWPATRIPFDFDEAAGPGADDGRPAEGIMQVMALQSAPPDPVRPPPTVPVLDVDLPDPVDVEPDALPEVDLTPPEIPEPGRGATTGTDPDDADAAGLPGATGAGGADPSEAGRGRTITPMPMGVIIPPTDVPRSVRGTAVRILMFVNEEGRVVPDSTRLDPPTPDRDYNAALIHRANGWRFHPAREDGEAVASWFHYVIGPDGS